MSQFLKHTDEYQSEYPAGIDFDDAVKLSGGGSTCDIYKTRWQRREVFVKRLKEEYRFKPLYLDALDKEFDIGVGLRHPSLPEYREFHRDYIIMDYIDGETLAGMVRSNDPWLTKEKHVISLLKELVDVVDYLHRHNVVHCDIKPDNIMITANNRNLVLIDFDKSYTDAQGDTSGHPAKYGLTLDEKGRTDIDFRGIGMLVEKLKSSVPGFKFSRYKQFVKACFRTDVNCDDLREILESSVKGRGRLEKRVLIVVVSIIAATLMIGFGWYLFDRKNEQLANKVEEFRDVEKASNEDVSTSSPQPVEDASEPVIETQERIHDDAQNKAAVLDRRINPAFNELLGDLDRLNALKSDSTLTAQQLLDNIRRHGVIAEEYISEAFAILNETFPGLSEREAWRIMSYSKAYTGYMRRATPELRDYGHEIERRFKSEGRSPQ